MFVVELNMRKKSLIDTNPYLRDKKKYEAALITNVISSSAIESVHVTQAKLLKKEIKPSKKN